MTNKKEWLHRRNEDAKQAHAALMKFYPLDLEDLDGEVWKPIPDFEELYQVSNFGRVKSFWHGKPRIMKPNVSFGYLRIQLCKDGKAKKFLVHRLVAQAFIPNPDAKPQVNHIDGHSFNNHADNLEWATGSENIQHSFAMGLQVGIQGENRSDAKLTDEQARYVRENPDGLSQYKLAERFGVSLSTIGEIQLGRKYKSAGGTIRGKIDRRIPDEVREQIRAEYQEGVRGCGSFVLAKKYGVHQTTILDIVKEK